MEETKINVQQYARLSAIYLGIFYIIRFATVPLSFSMPIFSFAFMLLVVASPFITYALTARFRILRCGGSLSFGRGWIFAFSTMAYAGLIEALGVYVYFRFIDKGAMLNGYMDNIAQAEQQAGANPVFDQLRESVNTLATVTPIDLAMSIFSNGIIWAILLATFIALMARRKNKNITNQN